MYTDGFMCYSWSKSFAGSDARIGFVTVNALLEANDLPIAAPERTVDLACGRLLRLAS